MSGDVLASIDGALRDRALSKDAMRWLPEDRREAPAPEPVPVVPALDLGAFTAAMDELGRMMRRFFCDLGTALGRLSPLLAVMTDAGAQWRERRRGGGKPAVDGHEYRRRQRDRVRRKRRHRTAV